MNEMIERIRVMRENTIKTRDEASAMIAAYDKILAELSTVPKSGDDANPDAWETLAVANGATTTSLDIGRSRLTGQSGQSGNAKPTKAEKQEIQSGERALKASEQRRCLLARLLATGPKKLGDIAAETKIPHSSLISVLRHHQWFEVAEVYGTYQLSKKGQQAVAAMREGRIPVMEDSDA